MKKSKIGILFILLPIFLFIIYGQISAILYEKELDKNGKINIAKIDSIQDFPKRSYVYNSYYIKGKKYNTSQSNQQNLSKKDVGKFYEIKYLPSKPNLARCNFKKQITDTIKILKAGFNSNDLITFKKR